MLLLRRICLKIKSGVVLLGEIRGLPLLGAKGLMIEDAGLSQEHCKPHTILINMLLEKFFISIN